MFNPSTGIPGWEDILKQEDHDICCHLMDLHLQVQHSHSCLFLSSYVACNWDKVDNGPLVIVWW